VVALAVVTPVLEVALLVQVGRAIGFWPTLLLLVLEALFGVWLMRREGSRAWRALRETAVSGRLPGDELTDAALVLAGGILFVLPGFLTDAVGFVFLLPFTRPLARSAVGAVAAQRARRLGVELDLAQARTQPDMTIDGEVVEAPTAGATRAPRRDGGGEPPAISGTVL